MSKPPSLIQSLHQTLLSIHTNPYPTLANPANCPRRASVALILRVRPLSSTERPQAPISPVIEGPQGPSSSYENQLESFFSLPWVQSGIPEILFIKRAARRGDRWTSHIALPGGKRDPGDSSDEVTAERETMEEVGIDLNLSAEHSHIPFALRAGSLPQRVITTDFGFVPLMVLCPFVYLLTSPASPRLQLQSSEVASAHWIPIPALLNPHSRTFEAADIVDRFAGRWGYTIRTAMSWSLGQVLYAAVRLKPSESVFSPDGPAEMKNENQGLLAKTREVVREDLAASLGKLGLEVKDQDPSRRLLLWGLTHGITCDFLGLLPNSKGLEWWRWPTLSRIDIRIMIWLVSYRFRKQKIQLAELGQISDRGPPVIVGEGLAVRKSEDFPRPATIYSAAGFLLNGYFEQIQRAVWITLFLRAVFGSVAAMWIWRWYIARRRARL